MLNIVELREGTWSPLVAMSPREYLARRLCDEVQRRNAFAASIGHSAGLRSVYTDSTIRTDVWDARKYRRLLQEYGVTRRQADAEIARFPVEREYKGLIDVMLVMSQQCLQNIGEHRERLASVPVGACPNMFLNAGAGPVIRGTGDVVLLNFGLNWLERWYPTVIVARGCEPTQSKAETVLAIKHLCSVAAGCLGSGEHMFSLEQMVPLYEMDQLVTSVDREIERRPLEVASAVFVQLQFVILHEFGHIALGHTDKLREWIRDKQSLSNPEILETMRSYEFAADEFAVDALLRDSRVEQNTLLHYLPTFFLLLHFADEDSNSGACDHPPGLDRLKRVMAHLIGPGYETAFEGRKETIRGLAQLSQELQNVEFKQGADPSSL